MKKFIYLLVFSLIFFISFSSCGEAEGESFNTSDYIYVMINIGKTTDTPNRDNKLFKVNGKLEADLKDNFDYVSSILTKEGHPFNLFYDTNEIFTFKVKAKDIKDVLNDYKITITTDEPEIPVKEFKDTGLGTSNRWCYSNDVKDITTEADFGDVKLVFIKYTYDNHYGNGYFDRQGQLHDKLTGENDDLKNALECSRGFRDEPIGVWLVEY